jgi:hypothetical protein
VISGRYENPIGRYGTPERLHPSIGLDFDITYAASSRLALNGMTLPFRADQLPAIPYWGGPLG